MKIVAYISVFMSLSTMAMAERVACTFMAPCMTTLCAPEAIPVTFEIDHNQFAPAHDPNEPPRNKVTEVAMGDYRFPAEPILMDDGTRGFWAVVAGVDHLMTVRPDGLGTYATSGAIPFMSGECEVGG